jgi:hypothetical protein
MNGVAGLMFGDMTQGNGGVWMTGVAGLMLLPVGGGTVGIRDLRETGKVHFVWHSAYAILSTSRRCTQFTNL